MPRAACPIRADEVGFSYCPISMFIEDGSQHGPYRTVRALHCLWVDVSGVGVHIYSDFAGISRPEVSHFNENLVISSNQCGRIQ